MPPSAGRYRADLYIDGAWRPGTGGERVIVSPSDEEIVGTAAEGSVADAAAAAAAARAAQPEWAAWAPGRRAVLFNDIAQRVAARQAEVARLIVAESGFVMHTALAQVEQSARFFRWAARACEDDHLLPTPPKSRDLPDGGRVMLNGVVQRRPIGVVACLTPYNGPFYGAAMKASMAMAMGNAVVVKPAPQNPLEVALLFEILEEAGLPPGVANLITSSDIEVGKALSTSRDVDMISFTGSTAVGRQIFQAGGLTMKRLLLECGGKGACLVLDDADVEKAIQTLASVWNLNNGQVCAAPTRALVHKSVQEKVIEGLRRLSRTLPVGPASDPTTVIGPVISATQRDRIEAYVSEAVQSGARLEAGGERPSFARGFFVEPTLLSHCRPEMAAVRDEIFGPVITLMAFDDEREAIRLANDSDYGLVDYVFSSNNTRAYAVASQLHAGTIQINGHLRNDDMPRGGWKQSGIGREGGLHGLLAYTEMAGIVWS